jgi:ribosomal-protein-alanine N-acetyltransferase
MNNGVDNDLWTFWGIFLNDCKQLIGTISLWNFDQANNSAELAFGLHPIYQHQGYMKESVTVVCHFGFSQLHLKTIFAYTEKENIPSQKLLVSLGFSFAKIFPEQGIRKKRTFYYQVYSLNK